jgi:hypothetical protein
MKDIRDEVLAIKTGRLRTAIRHWGCTQVTRSYYANHDSYLVGFIDRVGLRHSVEMVTEKEADRIYDWLVNYVASRPKVPNDDTRT